MTWQTLNDKELVTLNPSLEHRMRIQIRGSEPGDMVAYQAYRWGDETHVLGFSLSQAITTYDRRAPQLHKPRLNWMTFPYQQVKIWRLVRPG